MYCKNCGKEIPDGALICLECGAPQGETKFCKYCSSQIDKDCVICPKCGKQVEQIQSAQPNIVINNTNQNTNANTNTNTIGVVGYGKPKNKWVAFFLSLFLGYFGAHKFYEEKIGMGILYLLTFGLFGFGWIIDTIVLIFKPNPYFV